MPVEPAVAGGFTEAGGRQAVAALLADGRAPRAIVCGNDEMAIGALIALRAGRLRVPADVAVSGFDDIAAAHHVRPALTTVRQPMREMGEQRSGCCWPGSPTRARRGRPWCCRPGP